MDYKYIEQLLERYWECQTTLEEEAILRTFFRQEDVPANLLPYRQLFVEEDKMAGEHLSEDFTDRMLRMVGEEVPLTPFMGKMANGQYAKARRLTFMHRLRPFYRAAGLIAIMLTIGNAAYQSFCDESLTPTPSLGREKIMAGEQWSMFNEQCSIDSKPEKQSAALTVQPTDTLSEFPR